MQTTTLQEMCPLWLNPLADNAAVAGVCAQSLISVVLQYKARTALSRLISVVLQYKVRIVLSGLISVVSQKCGILIYIFFCT